MEVGVRLELAHKLIMTPQLQQAIAILQLTSLELAAVIETQLLENPVLEIDEPADAEPTYLQEQDGLNIYNEWMDYLNRGSEYYEPYESKEDDHYDFRLAKPKLTTLQEHLELQLSLSTVDKNVHKAGLFLIGCIDNNGYLGCTLPEAAAFLKLDVEPVAKALELIQTFEPAGVGARSLQECLLLQAKYHNITNRFVVPLIENCLHDIAASKYKEAADKLGCTLQEIQAAVDIIRRFSPKPGQYYGGNSAGYIVPDVVIERISGKYYIQINESFQPRLVISSAYREMAGKADSETRKFLLERINSAVWLIKSIEQRRQTLYNVTQAIVKLQRDFFDNGPKYMKPLVMRTVAQELGIHESTVSRAVANKCAATPHGLISMHDFFPSGVRGMDGQDVAALTVKQEIKRIIAAENAAKPYSDQALADILHTLGINVSRRTVAKYREELGIASSGKRRRY